MGKIGQCQKQGACIDIFDPFWANKVYESNFSINH